MLKQFPLVAPPLAERPNDPTIAFRLGRTLLYGGLAKEEREAVQLYKLATDQDRRSPLGAPRPGRGSDREIEHRIAVRPDAHIILLHSATRRLEVDRPAVLPEQVGEGLVDGFLEILHAGTLYRLALREASREPQAERG
jgi:hypothetical protein